MGPVHLSALFTAVVGLGFYGLIIFVIWKFYQILSKINDNLGEIKQAIAGNPVSGPEESGSS